MQTGIGGFFELIANNPDDPILCEPAGSHSIFFFTKETTHQIFILQPIR